MEGKGSRGMVTGGAGGVAFEGVWGFSALAAQPAATSRRATAPNDFKRNAMQLPPILESADLTVRGGACKRLCAVSWPHRCC